MDILMVAAELAPYVRQTDAADAVAALSKSLRQLGHDVTVALPRHPGFEAGGLLAARRLTPLPLPGGGEVTVLDGQLSSGVKVVLFDAPVLFERPGVYGEEGEDYPDNAKRFGFLSQAAAALVRHRAQQGQAFDILHLHDWPGALVPLALRRAPGPTVPSVLTIHDVTRQGNFALRELDALGVPRELDDDDGLRLAGRLSVLKAGILFADVLTTVSPSYAEEMLNEELSGPLGSVLARSGKSVIGITSGVDYAYCNPATDAALVSRYDAQDPANKGRSKTALVRALDLDLDPDRPLIATLGELSESKGSDVLAAALGAILKNDVSVVIAGRGASSLIARLQAARAGHESTSAVVEGPDDALIHRVYGAADLVLVPSRHEPCGTIQLYAQRYGALPIVHAAGGLRDTVVDCDAALETGTGMLFDELTPKAVAGAVARGLSAYGSPSWSRLRRRLMRLDLSWDRPARRYLQVYRQTLGAAH